MPVDTLYRDCENDTEFLNAMLPGIVYIFLFSVSGLHIRAGAMTLLFKKILHLKGLKDKTVGEVSILRL